MRYVKYPNEYKTWINKLTRRFNFKLEFNGKTLTTNDVSSIKITSDLLPSDTFTIGSSVSETLEFDLFMDADTPINKSLPVKPYLSLYTEVKINNVMTPVYQEVCLGVFYINPDGITKKGLKTISIKASSMINHNDYGGRTYVAQDPFNGNANTIINDICSKLGITLKSSLPNITISNRDNINGMKYREVINYIAMLYGGYAKINNEGKLEFFKMKDTGYIYDTSNYSEITKISDETLKVKKFICALTENSSLSSGEGTIAETVELVNPDMTQSLLDSIKNTYLNYSYSPIKIKLLTSNPCLEVGDRIKVIDQKGKTLELPLQSVTYNLSGSGLTMDITSKYKVNSIKNGTSIRKAVNQLNADIIKTNIIVSEEIEATNARFDNLKANSGEFKDLFATNANIENLVTEKVNAEMANIDELYAKKAEINNLKADIAEIDSAIINKADITDLNAFKAQVAQLYATKAEIADLDVSNLQADLAEIKTLVNGNLTSDNIQSLILSSDKVTVENGFIKNAMIDTVSANKISAGVLSTNEVQISSDDGGMVLAGNTQQFKDKNGNVRIQLGQDAQGDFNFILKGEDGTTVLIDETGIKENAISDGLIKDNMIGTGEISGNKINISSLVTEINKDDNTSTIKGTKIMLDDQNQTLDLAFNSMKTSLDENTNDISTHTTSIGVMQGQIKTLISDTSIIEDGETKTIKDAYSSLNQTVNGINSKVGEHTTTIRTLDGKVTTVEGKQSKLEQNLNGFKTTVSETYSTKDDLGKVTNRVTNVENEITTEAITNKISSTFVLKNDYDKALSDMEKDLQGQIDGKIETWSQNTDPSTAWTTTELKNKHTGDLWYNTNTKETKRWSGTAWVKLEDADAKNAEALAKSKKRVFTGTPTTPYDVGDLWITSLTSNGTIKICKTARASGSYNAGDWVESLKYTDDTLANKIQNDLNSLTIGGRNLLKNSAFTNGTSGWTISNNKWSLDNSLKLNGHSSAKIVCTGLTQDSWYGPITYNLVDSTIYKGVAYTASCWYYVKDKTTLDKSLTIEIKGKKANSTNEVVIAGASVSPSDITNEKWTKLVVKFNTSEDYNNCCVRAHLVRNGTAWVTDFKLEKGNKATDWTPAPEDSETYIDNLVSDLQEQVDGKIETWSQSNDPSTAWTTTELKTKHNGDLWYNTSSKETKRWSGTAWVKLEDIDAKNAESLAKSKKRVFTGTPTTPYDVGDLWITSLTSKGIIKICKTARASGNYNASDWVESLKYTDDTLANQLKNDLNNLSIGGRNYILNGKGDKKAGFFKNFSKVENGYGEHTLTSQKTYATLNIAPGFILGCRDYEVGKQVTMSYDFMYTAWNFPEGTNRQEFWIGQRYSNSSDSSASGQWRGVTFHNLPVVGENGCVLNKWIHITKTFTIPEQADSSVRTDASIQFYNSNANVSASITFRIKNVKLEYGNRATDWSPSPEDTETYVDNLVADLQEQVDGKVETWSQTTDPSTAWTTTDAKTKHTGDLWYNSNTKETKRWSGTAWVKLEDADAKNAESLAKSKKRVFTGTPTTPYDVGDLWITSLTSNGVVKVCKTARASGNYTASDWVESLKYTDDTLANQLKNDLNNLTIGGRNILCGTSKSVSKTTDKTSSYVTLDPYFTYKKQNLSSFGFKVGDKVTISFDWKIAQNGTNAFTYGDFRIEWVKSDGSYITVIQNPVATFSTTNVSGHAEIVDTLSSNELEAAAVRFRIDNSNLVFTVSNMKVEKGNKATAWTPSIEDTETYVDNLVNDLQTQVDGKIETWSQNTDPSTAWTTTDLKNKHKGDLWYNTSSKETKRWSGTAWTKLEDGDAKNAESLAKSKKRVFTGTPTIPYDVGDLWITSLSSNGVVKVCKTARASGNYSASDWVESLKYTDDTKANEAISSAADVKSRLDNLSIGGTNLLPLTNQGTTGWGWGLASGSATLESLIENGIECCKMIRDNVACQDWSYIRYNIIRDKFLPSTRYTLSFDVKPSITTYFDISIRCHDSSNPLTDNKRTSKAVANKWNKLSVTLTTLDTFPDNVDQILYISGMDSSPGVSYIFRNLMLEKGSTYTDWSPAPEDIDLPGIYAKISEGNADVIKTMEAYTKEELGKITSHVQETYLTQSEFGSFQEQYSSDLQQTSRDLTATFTEQISAEMGDYYQFKETVNTNIRFSSEGIEIGKTNSPFKSKFSNTKLSFLQNDKEVAFISNNKMYIENGEIMNQLAIGHFVFMPRDNGNMTLKWIN